MWYRSMVVRLGNIYVNTFKISHILYNLNSLIHISLTTFGKIWNQFVEVMKDMRNLNCINIYMYVYFSDYALKYYVVDLHMP